MNKLVILIGICVAINVVRCVDINCNPHENPKVPDELCKGNYPLGISTGIIPDSSLTASSSFDFKTTGPQNARLNKEINGGAWCPYRPISKHDFGHYLDVNLNNSCVVKSIMTQGRYANGSGEEFTPYFHLQYIRNGSWIKFCNPMTSTYTLEGNIDTSSVKTNDLQPWIYTSYLRIIPVTLEPTSICLRTELTGCYVKDVGVVESPEIVTSLTTHQPVVTESTEVAIQPGNIEDNFIDFVLRNAWMIISIATAFITGIFMTTIVYTVCLRQTRDDSIHFYVSCDDPSEGLHLLPVGQVNGCDVDISRRKQYSTV